MSGEQDIGAPAYKRRSRGVLLRLLKESGRPLDATEIGRMAGLHRNSARAHLEDLVSAGLVNRRTEVRSSRGRPRVLYEAAAREPDGPEDPGAGRELGYFDLAQALAGQMTEIENVANEAIRAGRRWAAAYNASPLAPENMSPRAAMVAVCRLFEVLGFGPELAEEENRIRLHRCPFAEVASQARPVVCGMHLGMLKATLERLGAPLEVTEFQPLVREDALLCVVGFREKPRPKDRPSGGRSRSG